MDSNEKVFGVLAYLGWLVLVPLLAGKTEFSKFHANQGLILTIAETVVIVAFGIVIAFTWFIPIIGGLIIGIFSLVCLIFTIFAIIGIVNAAQGQMKPLPIIGEIKILK